MTHIVFAGILAILLFALWLTWGQVEDVVEETLHDKLDDVDLKTQHPDYKAAQYKKDSEVTYTKITDSQ